MKRIEAVSEMNVAKNLYDFTSLVAQTAVVATPASAQSREAALVAGHRHPAGSSDLHPPGCVIPPTASALEHNFPLRAHGGVGF